MKKKFTSIKNKYSHINKRTKKKIQLKGGADQPSLAKKNIYKLVVTEEEKKEYEIKYAEKMQSIWGLLEEEGILINDIIQLKIKKYGDIGGSSQDEVIKFILAQPEIMQEVGRKSTPAKYRVNYRINYIFNKNKAP